MAEENTDIVDTDFATLIDYKITQFYNKRKYCLALNKDNTQCSHYMPNKPENHNNNLLCPLHSKKKYKPKYIIVYIDNDNDNGNGNGNDHDNDHGRGKIQSSDHPQYHTIDTNIIVYPYKNKEQYFIDIELYKQELKNIANENYVKLKQLNNCKVCSEDCEPCNLTKCNKITCENKHAVCSTCIKGYIGSQISSSIGSYECIFNKAEKCGGEYTITSINTIFENFYETETESKPESKPEYKPESEIIIYSNKTSTSVKNDELKSNWLKLVTLTDIYKLANVCDDYVICPLCRGWGCIFEEDHRVKNKVYINCQNCTLKWCSLCKREAHGDDPAAAGEYDCYSLNFKDTETDDQRITIIDTLIQDIISKALTHNCSTCGCAYIKEEGCNLMVCSHCGGMSCYLCNAKIYYKEGKGKYWHFAGYEYSDPDTTCTVWNNIADDGQENQGNTNYNNTKILKELILLILNNSKITGKIIYDRIIFLYEKDESFNFIVKVFEELNKDNFNNIPEYLLTY